MVWRMYEKSTPAPPEDFVRVEWTSLKEYIVEVFCALGAPRNEAEIAADVLVTADLMGIESHGVQRLRRYTTGIRIGSVKPRAVISIIRETPTVALIDGGASLGQVVAYRAMEIAIEKAENSGVAVVGVRNSHHFGIAGYYALQAVKRNMIGIVATNSEALVSYTHTVGRNMGTNPIAIGFPTKIPPPILFDASTSIVPIGKIELYAKQGRRIPLGWALSPEGNPTDDPNDVLEKKGSLLPLGGFGEEFGGHKGSGLALAIDILCGVLTGANYGTLVKHTTAREPANVGHFMIVIDINRILPTDLFLDRIEEYRRYIKNLKKISKDSEIWLPGEKAWLTMETRKRIGIPVHKNILKEIKEEGERLGVEFRINILKETA